MGTLKRVLVVTLTARLATIAVPARDVQAWSPTCTLDGLHNKYAGMGISPTGIEGAQANIEWFDTSLCNQGSNPDYSWSLSWVSIVGRTSPSPGDILQGGFAKCANVTGGLSCPYNSGKSYYWYFGACADGGCGPESDTGFQKALKGNASSGLLNYQIAYNSPDDIYYFSIAGVRQYGYPGIVVRNCWSSNFGTGAVTGAQLMNEMLDNGDQNAGTVSNHQSFAQIQYQSATGWHNTSWTLGRACDANSDPTDWSCFVASASHNTFYNYDRRAP